MGGDGGAPGDAGSSASGRVLVDFTAGPEALPAGVTLDAASLGIAELQARNDRGGEDEPSLETGRSVDLLSPPTIDLSPAAPATYGRLTAHVGSSDTWGPAISLRFTEEEHGLVIVDLHDLSVDARCNPVVTLLPGGELRMHVAIDVASLYQAVHAGDLPDPQDGVVEVDGETAPDAIGALEAAFPAAVALTCEMHNP